ncbi:MAG TPA: hypothetical protein VHD56_00480 [Tepidisphaeraceae bacterium]|nr:hypothetical protein [Tepidisphaeraceae bacterium]
MKNKSERVQEVQSDRKPYARPQLVKHGNVETQTQLVAPSPSQQQQ